MKTVKEVINGDFRQQETADDAQIWLKKIDVLNKRTEVGQDVSIDDLEKVFIKLQSKYDVKMQWISLSILEGELPWYSISFKHGDTHLWMGSLYGKTIYEVFCKSVLFLYANTRKTRD